MGLAMKLTTLTRARAALTAAAAALVLTGCGMTAREALMRADARWQAATGIAEPWPRVVQVRTSKFKCGFVDEAIGCYNYKLDRVILATGELDDAELEQTAVHEWGHRLGAGHVHTAGAVMAPQLTTATNCITWADIDAVCSVRDCQWEKPEKCE